MTDLSLLGRLLMRTLGPLRLKKRHLVSSSHPIDINVRQPPMRFGNGSMDHPGSRFLGRELHLVV